MNDEYEDYKPFGGLQSKFASLLWLCVTLIKWFGTQLVYCLILFIYVSTVLGLLFDLWALYDLALASYRGVV